VAEVIRTVDLNKVYEGARRGLDVHALKDLNLEIQEGEIFGYLGPNGSGKTTTIKMLLGLIFPTAGTIEIMGKKDIGAPSIRKSIGYLPEGAYYPDFLRGEEVLNYYGRLYGLGGSNLQQRIDKVLEVVGMTHARKRLIRGYSKGMRQRVGLAQALLADPQILILDEPTTGLDPIARLEIRDILARLRDEGKTLLISSHELLEVELISDRVGILYNGVLQACGNLTDLLTDRDLTIKVKSLSPESKGRLEQSGITVETEVKETALLRVPETVDMFTALEACKASGATVVSVAPRRETLEEFFVRVVGKAKDTPVTPEVEESETETEEVSS